MLGISVPGLPTNFNLSRILIGQGPTLLALGTSRGYFDIFLLPNIFVFFLCPFV